MRAETRRFVRRNLSLLFGWLGGDHAHSFSYSYYGPKRYSRPSIYLGVVLSTFTAVLQPCQSNAPRPAPIAHAPSMNSEWRSALSHTSSRLSGNLDGPTSGTDGISFLRLFHAADNGLCETTRVWYRTRRVVTTARRPHESFAKPTFGPTRSTRKHASRGDKKSLMRRANGWFTTDTSRLMWAFDARVRRWSKQRRSAVCFG